ncbi:MAG: hypothetical protein FWG67_03045 [Defluviitaleaceae bacterium]|nr:hypothetical protein [Defluviitaleaceae bacterium]
MNMNDLVNEESEFIEGLQGILENLGVKIDVNSLATILHEYELAKMDFLKAHIMKLLEDRGGDFENSPVKVVVSQSGFDFDAMDENDDLSDFTDTDFIA